MYSYNHFTPGNTTGNTASNTNRIKNMYYFEDVHCRCLKNRFINYRNTSISGISTDIRDTTPNISNKQRVSQLLSSSVGKGGKTHFGAAYTGQPRNINYLGRTEGQSGGSGSAPGNRF